MTGVPDINTSRESGIFVWEVDGTYHVRFANDRSLRTRKFEGSIQLLGENIFLTDLNQEGLNESNDSINLVDISITEQRLEYTILLIVMNWTDFLLRFREMQKYI